MIGKVLNNEEWRLLLVRHIKKTLGKVRVRSTHDYYQSESKMKQSEQCKASGNGKS